MRTAKPRSADELLFCVAGGYYTIEQKLRKLRLVALNTNMYAKEDSTDPDPTGQWAWLENVLAKSYRQKETVS